MQGHIESRLSGLSLHFIRNINIGKKSKRVGDIDLLVWRDDGDCALAVSLKWFYHPIYVQETWAQLDRLEKAISDHKRLMAAWPAAANGVSAAHGLRASLNVVPVLVLEPGPIRESARRLDMAVVSLEEFLTCLASFGADLSVAAAELSKTMTTVPSNGVTYRRECEQYGPYKFGSSRFCMGGSGGNGAR
jgi:hypothetical protein